MRRSWQQTATSGLKPVPDLIAVPEVCATAHGSDSSARQRTARQLLSLLCPLQQQKEEDPSQWMWGTLYIVVHEAQHLPGDPTLVGVSEQ